MDVVNLLVPWARSLVTKKDAKINYFPPAKEIRKLPRVSTKIAPLVVGCLRVVSDRWSIFLKDHEIPDGLQGCCLTVARSPGAPYLRALATKFLNK